MAHLDELRRDVGSELHLDRHDVGHDVGGRRGDVLLEVDDLQLDLAQTAALEPARLERLPVEELLARVHQLHVGHGDLEVLLAHRLDLGDHGGEGEASGVRETLRHDNETDVQLRLPGRRFWYCIRGLWCCLRGLRRRLRGPGRCSRCLGIGRLSRHRLSWRRFRLVAHVLLLGSAERAETPSNDFVG